MKFLKDIFVVIVFFYLVYQAFYGYWYMSTYSKIDAYAESKIYELIDNERRYREKYAYSQGKTEHEVELLMKHLEPSYQREIEKMKDSAYVDWDIDSVLGLEVGIYSNQLGCYSHRGS